MSLNLYLCKVLQSLKAWFIRCSATMEFCSNALLQSLAMHYSMQHSNNVHSVLCNQQTQGTQKTCHCLTLYINHWNFKSILKKMVQILWQIVVPLIHLLKRGCYHPHSQSPRDKVCQYNLPMVMNSNLLRFALFQWNLAKVYNK